MIIKLGRMGFMGHEIYILIGKPFPEETTYKTYIWVGE